MTAEIGSNGGVGGSGPSSAKRASGLGDIPFELALDALLRLPSGLLERIARSTLERRMSHLPEALDFVVSLVLGLQRRRGHLSAEVRSRFFRNLFGNEFMRGVPARHRVAARTGGYAPELMVVSPSMRCNLRCTGCYSGNYRTDDELTTAELDDLVRQVKELGIYFVVISGGEPYMRADLLDLFEKHNDVLFLTYTNGTLLDRDGRAERLARLGNVIPAISVEGFERETDARRGPGIHRRVLEAMAALRSAGVLFGFSATPTRSNNEVLVSDEFVDYYVEQGCFLGFYFQYMPVGRDPDLTLMTTPEQREYRRRRVRSLRQRKPILLIDFWCDGPLVDGCLSAAREYFHVNSRGGIEPCVFNQFSVDNIRTKPLAEAIDSPYFRYLRGRLSEIENRLRPCPIIDRPQILRDSVDRYHPVCSQAGGDATVTRLAPGLNDYARRLRVLVDAVWEKEYRRRTEVGTDFHIEREATEAATADEPAGSGRPNTAGGTGGAATRGAARERRARAGSSGPSRPRGATSGTARRGPPRAEDPRR